MDLELQAKIEVAIDHLCDGLVELLNETSLSDDEQLSIMSGFNNLGQFYTNTIIKIVVNKNIVP